MNRPKHYSPAGYTVLFSSHYTNHCLTVLYNFYQHFGTPIVLLMV